MKYSECCHAEATPVMEDYGICPECQDNCEFIDYDSDDDDIMNDFCHEGGIKYTIEIKKP